MLGLLQGKMNSFGVPLGEMQLCPAAACCGLCITSTPQSVTGKPQHAFSWLWDREGVTISG